MQSTQGLNFLNLLLKFAQMVAVRSADFTLLPGSRTECTLAPGISFIPDETP